VIEEKVKEVKCNFCKVLTDTSFLIALVVIIPFVVFTGMIIFFGIFENLKDLISIWTAWVGSVIGYFFGSRPVEALTDRVEKVLKDVDDGEDYYEEILDDYEEKLDVSESLIEEYKNKFDKSVSMIQYLLAKHGGQLTNLDKGVSERLKNEYGVII
jgi:hypothetical protein